MAKFRESAYVNDFVMFRNACEERKLKYTLSHIERLKSTYNKQQDKEKLFFAVQHLSVPSQRKQKPAAIGDQSAAVKKVKLRSLSAPSLLDEVTADENNDVTVTTDEEATESKDDGKLLNKRRSMTVSDIKPMPCEIQVYPTRSRLESPKSQSKRTSICSLNLESSKGNIDKTSSSNFQNGDTTEAKFEKKSLLTVERVSKFNKKEPIKRGCSSNSTRSSFSETSRFSMISNATRTYLEDKERKEKELLSELINKRKSKETDETHKNPKSGLSQLPSKEEWERQINCMKRANQDLTRRQQQEIERKARDRWRQSFENMKMNRLAVYQSKIYKSGAEESNTTFVKFLPKSQQAFYIKDVQFAQKFL
uniref:Putative cnidarian restricted protein n=1 Tax=Clytia hemisphaerica TaxID=252671 RepID=A0A069DUY9_9CNID